MTLDERLLEGDAVAYRGEVTDELIVAYSSAISLKRIADVLSGEGFGELLRTPVNGYGESFTDAIQMAFIRGQQGNNRI